MKPISYLENGKLGQGKQLFFYSSLCFEVPGCVLAVSKSEARLKDITTFGYITEAF